MPTRRLLRHLSWVCACAAFFAAIAPAISKMVHAAEGTHLVEVCSTEGRRFVAVDDAGPAFPAAPALEDHPCGYCYLQAHSPFAATPASSAALPAATPGFPPPARESGPSVHRLATRANLTRAPPLDDLLTS